jgi:hypothetical protein
MAHWRGAVRISLSVAVLALFLGSRIAGAGVGAAGGASAARAHSAAHPAAAGATAAGAAAAPAGAPGLASRLWGWIQGLVGAGSPTPVPRTPVMTQTGGCPNPDGSPCT